MRALKDLSIKTKLNLLVWVACGVALLLSTGAFVLNDIHLIRASKVQQLSALAKVLGFNSTAALTFDDPTAAGELLSSLSLQPTVQFACLYNAQGKVFAVFRSAQGRALAAPPLPREEGHRFVPGGHLDVVHQVLHDGEQVGTLYLRAGMDDLYEQFLRYAAIGATVLVGSLGVAILLSFRLQRMVSEPILRLAQTAQQISAQRDYSLRVKKEASDELGTLYDEFNAMLDQIQRGEKNLQEAHDQLEARVEQRTEQLSQANRELSREVTERKRAERELEEAHQQLLDAARKAGMAEIATGVLHNVGNVLNSINVSATLVADWLRNSNLADLARAMDLMNQHSADLGGFLTEHEKGKQLPRFLQLVSLHLRQERAMMIEELQSLTKNIDHIKTIVAMQQSYAGVAGVVESVSLADLIDDALRINSASFDKYGIELIRDYADLPEVQAERPKLLQILVNLLTNAKDALVEGPREGRRLTVRIRTAGKNGERKVRVEILDNGVGIPKENLTRVFSHGFTTKKHGHGFGLHSSANAAKELGGTLVAHSDGPGRGATFILELPFQPVEVLV